MTASCLVAKIDSVASKRTKIDPFTGKALESEAARRRREATERAALVAAMGWEPEDGTADGRYVATLGELRQMVRARAADLEA